MNTNTDNPTPIPSSRIGISKKNRLPALAGATLLGLAGAGVESAHAQGCVPIRNNPGTSLLGGANTDTSADAGSWAATLGYRFFQSGRHFKGDNETHRDTEGASPGNQVINTVNTFDVAATYNISARWSVSLDLPYTDAERSSLYEHGATINGQKRFSMFASGVGDLRLTSDYWLLDPKTHPNGNIALGLGVSFPTGDDAATDISHRTAAKGGDVVRPVDQSIQPGSGGYGIILEMQAYQKVYGNLFAYLNGGYTITPEEQTNTETPLGDTAPANSPSKYNSIPDQYLGRLGLSYPIWEKAHLAMTLGGRIEGVPDYDAIGGSLGFRRPGYVVSVEPGLNWMGKRNSIGILTPVAVYRARIQSAPEYATGAQRPGDAAFADWSILASYTFRF